MTDAMDTYVEEGLKIMTSIHRIVKTKKTYQSKFVYLALLKKEMEKMRTEMDNMVLALDEMNEEETRKLKRL